MTLLSSVEHNKQHHCSTRRRNAFLSLLLHIYFLGIGRANTQRNRRRMLLDKHPDYKCHREWHRSVAGRIDRRDK